MVEEFIELMNLGVIKFPYEYNGDTHMQISSGVDEKLDEIAVLMNYHMKSKLH